MRIRFRAAGAVIACVCVCCSKPSPLSPPVVATCYLTSITPDGGWDHSVYTCDTNHQLLVPKDANGVPLWTAVYDKGDKRTMRTGTRIDTLFFDANRRLIQRVVFYDSGKNVGEIHTFQYNSFGQLKSSTDAYFTAGVLVLTNILT